MFSELAWWLVYFDYAYPPKLTTTDNSYRCGWIRIIRFG